MSSKWLVAYDFSPLSELALDYAVTNLAASGGEIHLLHVHRPLSAQFSVELSAVSPAFGDADSTIAAAARARLAEIAAAIVERHPALSVSDTVCPGYPPDVIVEVASDEACDQIVLGSHGRTGLKRLFVGSVAEHVVRHADRTVVVVKDSSPDADPA